MADDQQTHPPQEPGAKPGATDDDRKGNVIAFSRYRAELGRARRVRRGDALLEASDPGQAIRALPGDELYYIVHERGLRDSLDILVHASAEQVQSALDFSVWQRDVVAPGRLAEWVDVMAHARPAKIVEWITGMDSEMVGLLIRKGARIYDLSLGEEPPDEPEGRLYPTPDGYFVLELLGYSEEGADPDAPLGALSREESADALLRIVDTLYRGDMNAARRLLVGARTELDSTLEEMAYRWRTGRMSDLGFAEYYEALEVYRELDPATVHVGESKPGAVRVRPSDASERPDASFRAPAVLMERLGSTSPFVDALSRVSDPGELAELQYALVALTNRVLAADRVAPGDDQAVARAIERLRATLDLAVDALARGDDQRATEAVRTIALVRLFRLGVTLTGKVRRLALALARRGPFAASGRDLFEPVDDAVLEPVTRLRPLYPAFLDDPSTPAPRPFASLADLSRATLALEQAGAAQALLLALGVRPEHLVEDALAETDAADPDAPLDTGVLARTALVRALLTDSSDEPELPMPFAPLEPEQLRDFEQRLRSAASSAAGTTAAEAPMKLPETLRRKAKAILDAAAPASLGKAASEVAKRWIDSLAPLEPVLVRRPARRPRGK